MRDAKYNALLNVKIITAPTTRRRNVPYTAVGDIPGMDAQRSMNTILHLWKLRRVPQYPSQKQSIGLSIRLAHQLQLLTGMADILQLI